MHDGLGIEVAFLATGFGALAPIGEELLALRGGDEFHGLGSDVSKRNYLVTEGWAEDCRFGAPQRSRAVQAGETHYIDVPWSHSGE